MLFAEEVVDLTEGVAAIVEADETFFALRAAHGGFEGVVDVENVHAPVLMMLQPSL